MKNIKSFKVFISEETAAGDVVQTGDGAQKVPSKKVMRRKWKSDEEEAEVKKLIEK